MLTSDIQVEDERHVWGGGHLALVLPGVLAGDVPDHHQPLGGANLVVSVPGKKTVVRFAKSKYAGKDQVSIIMLSANVSP